mgnify:CR=1 FL=1
MVGCADMTAMAAERSSGGRLGRVWGAFHAHFPCSGRTHARLPAKRLRTIHRLASANIFTSKKAASIDCQSAIDAAR